MSGKQSQEDTLDWIKQTPVEEDDDTEVVVSGDLILQGQLCIADAEAMHLRLSKLLHAQVDISINSEALSRVDAAGIQLLYALVKEAKKRAVAVVWLSVSPALQEAADTLGLTQGMGFEVADA